VTPARKELQNALLVLEPGMIRSNGDVHKSRAQASHAIIRSATRPPIPSTSFQTLCREPLPRAFVANFVENVVPNFVEPC
jgi:hypothetical protein